MKDETYIAVAGLIVVDGIENLPVRPGDSTLPPYRGIDRDAWRFIGDAFYEHKLSPELQNCYRDLDSQNKDLSGVEVSQNVADVLKIAHYHKAKGRSFEILAVRSKYLLELKGSINLPERIIKWVGEDIFVVGEWSLIAEGIYRAPEFFSDFARFINTRGLISKTNTQLVNAYVARHKDAVVADLVEETDYSAQGVDRIEVGLVNVNKLHAWEGGTSS